VLFTSRNGLVIGTCAADSPDGLCQPPYVGNRTIDARTTTIIFQCVDLLLGTPTTGCIFDGGNLFPLVGIQDAVGALLLVSFSGITFQRSFFPGSGAALYVQPSQPPPGGELLVLLDRCNFKFNRAYQAPAIYVGAFSRLRATSTRIENNTQAAPSNPGILALGAAVVVRDGKLDCASCVFALNQGSGLGGALALVSATSNLEGCNFEENIATYGGAIGIVSGATPASVTISTTRFYYNRAACGSNVYVLSTSGARAVVDLTAQSLPECALFDTTISSSTAGRTPNFAVSPAAGSCLATRANFTFAAPVAYSCAPRGQVIPLGPIALLAGAYATVSAVISVELIKLGFTWAAAQAAGVSGTLPPSLFNNSTASPPPRVAASSGPPQLDPVSSPPAVNATPTPVMIVSGPPIAASPPPAGGGQPASGAAGVPIALAAISAAILAAIL